jgi:hypothetical protein
MTFSSVPMINLRSAFQFMPEIWPGFYWKKYTAIIYSFYPCGCLKAGYLGPKELSDNMNQSCAGVASRVVVLRMGSSLGCERSHTHPLRSW